MDSRIQILMPRWLFGVALIVFMAACFGLFLLAQELTVLSVACEAA